MTKKMGPCPYCSGRYVTNANSLEKCFASVAAEFHPKLNRLIFPSNEVNKSWYPKIRIAPEEIPQKNCRLRASDLSAHSSEICWWKCRKDDAHIWKASVSDRTDGHGCPYCAGKKVDSGNSLSSKYAQVSRMFHPTRNAPVTAD